jgi:hypothetical protein
MSELIKGGDVGNEEVAGIGHKYRQFEKIAVLGDSLRL